MSARHDGLGGENKMFGASEGSLSEVLGRIQADSRDFPVELKELNEGEVLFHQGEPGDCMYFVTAGVLGVQVEGVDGQPTEIDRVAPGEIVGEMALVSGQPRTATVYAINSASVMRLTADALAAISSANQAVSNELAEIMTPRWQRLLLSRMLTEIFGDLDAASLHSIQQRVQWMHYSNGDVICRQGEDSDGMYILISGRLRITHSDESGETRILGEIGAGETFGEFAVFTEEKRSATLHAVRDSLAVKISSELLKELSAEFPSFVPQIARSIIRRQQKRLSGSPSQTINHLVIALVPLVETTTMAFFTRNLADSLVRFGPTILIDSAKVAQRKGNHGVSEEPSDEFSSPETTMWLHELENAHQYVLLRADYGLSSWSRQAISQADRVIFIADASGAVDHSSVEGYLKELQVPVRSELVLLHEKSATEPRNTARWLEGRHFAAHYHVRLEDDDHMRRLTRRLTGRAIALVGSGGGARGYAHVGVYRAMSDLGIPIDYFGGTSIGALVIGLLALDKSYDELIEYGKTLADRSRIFDYTIPLTSIMRSGKVTRICRELFGDILIEDFWSDYFCVSTNLTRAEPVVHRSGPAWLAIRASISIPGIFAPVVHNGELLVDGGPMNNFPVDIMRRLSESDRVIGVHVTPHTSKQSSYSYDTEISGWRILLGRLSPFHKRLRAPSLATTILRSIAVNSAHQTHLRSQQADLIIYPDVRQYGFLDFGVFEPLIEAGYNAAYEPLKAWAANQQF